MQGDLEPKGRNRCCSHTFPELQEGRFQMSVINDGHNSYLEVLEEVKPLELGALKVGILTQR